MDSPYRVERTVMPRGNHSMQTAWVIMRVGEEPLAYSTDANFIYRLVGLLNAEEARRGSAGSPGRGTPSCPPGSRGPT